MPWTAGDPRNADHSAAAPARRDAVRFFDDDRALARLAADFLAEGLTARSPALVIATAGVRAAVVDQLTRRLVDVAALQRSHDLLLLDAAETLSTFMVNGMPDPRRFSETMCQAIERVCRGRAGCTVRIFGQLVDVLWRRGEHDAAIRLEVLLNQVARTDAFSLVYSYAVGHFFKAAHHG